MSIKGRLFHIAGEYGGTSAVRSSDWRRRRLLVLCYHGLSLADEHEWNPGFYMRPETFRQRLQHLRDERYTVLPLDEAVRRLYDGTLPPRSVALTFDDGMHDFAVHVRPLLEEFDVPATLYLTTYHVARRLPVFDPAVSYVLWRGRASGADVASLVDHPTPLPVATETERATALAALHAHWRAHDLDTTAKDALLGAVAARLGVPLDEMHRRQLLYVMSPDEVRALPPELVDVQLHTHRHRTPRDERLFRREVVDNRDAIAALTGSSRALTHFCYPSGDYAAAFLPWLRAEGVRYATTCLPALAGPEAEPLLLPRFVDTEAQTMETFAAWASGLAALLPVRGMYRLDPARA